MTSSGMREHIICHAGVREYHLIKYILVPCFHMKSECPLTPNQTTIGDLHEFPNPPPPTTQSQGLIKNIVTKEDRIGVKVRGICW